MITPPHAAGRSRAAQAAGPRHRRLALLGGSQHPHGVGAAEPVAGSGEGAEHAGAGQVARPAR